MVVSRTNGLQCSRTQSSKLHQWMWGGVAVWISALFWRPHTFRSHLLPVCDTCKWTFLGQRDWSWFSTDKIWLNVFYGRREPEEIWNNQCRWVKQFMQITPSGTMEWFPHHLLSKGSDMEVTEGHILELENLLDFQNAKIPVKSFFRIVWKISPKGGRREFRQGGEIARGILKGRIPSETNEVS